MYRMNTFSLKIIACDKVFYDGECEILIFPVAAGEMAIMANHEGFTTVTEIGEIRFRIPGGEYINAIVSDGILRVDKNEAIFLAYSAEKPEDIDTFRAQAALERAREQLQQKQSIVEYHVSTASMAAQGPP